MGGRNGGQRYPKGFDELATFSRLISCILYKWCSIRKGWIEIDSPHTVYLRKCADRTGYTVYKNQLWNIEMRDDGGAYLVEKVDRSVLTKVS